MKQLLGKLFAVAVVVIGSASVQAFNPAFQKYADQLGIDLNVSYQAVRVMQSRQGTFEFAERRSPQKLLMDMTFQGMQAALLIREDLNTSYMLMPSMGMYREMPLEDAYHQSASIQTIQEIAKVGVETVNGHESGKYRAAFSSTDGSGEGYVWVTETGVPIKMDMTFTSRHMKGERLLLELRDLKIGPQKPELFELSPDLKPMNFGGIPGLSR